MIIDHADLARRIFDASHLPDPPRPPDVVLNYLTRLLSWLPAGEVIGYVKAPPGGENALHLPDGTLVRIARVMTPDGQIYKVMNDVPNGGPQWVPEDIRPDLYVPYIGPHYLEPEPDTPDGDSNRVALLEGKVATIERQVEDLTALHNEQQRQIGAINEQIATLFARPAPVPVIAAHVHKVKVATVFGRQIILTSGGPE